MKAILLLTSLCVGLLWIPTFATASPDAPHKMVSVEAVQGKADVKVWVNTTSGVYHCPGSRYYGNTKQGTYMTQGEAQKAGHRPANGRVCQ